MTSSINVSTLNGSNGFIINGIDTYAYLGLSVSDAGDINGDNFDDIIINGYGSKPFVVFGSSDGFPSSLELSSLDGSNGFVINDYTGGLSQSVSSAGDVNGDGFDDLIIGARGGSNVIFGSGSGFGASFDLSSLDGNNGFVLSGASQSVSSAGDVNGDGFDDLIIGAPGADPNGISSAGQSYVVFGSSGGFDPSLELSSLDGSNGFVINGIDANDGSGFSVSNAGDVNGDGFDDIIIGSYESGFLSAYVGGSYVVFGSGDGFSPTLELSSLDGSNGFVLNGIDFYDKSGSSVSGAGDVNGDGFDDFIIGARGGDGDRNSNGSAGESYVVFGRSNGFPSSFDLLRLDGSDGFVINGIDEGDYSGRSVSGAGDVNGDGIDDIIIGTSGFNLNGNSYAGESYVVFGRRSGFRSRLELSSLNGINGFVLNGIAGSSRISVSGAGDVNGDGFDDFIIGSPYSNFNGFSPVGQGYVVFGFSTPINTAPDAVDDSVSTDEDTAITIDVLANDSDAEGNNFTITSFDTFGTVGTLTNNGDGTFSYNPSRQFEFLNNGDTATDSFTYLVEDDSGVIDVATVNITINGVTEKAIDDSVSTDEDTAITIDVLANDPDGSNFTVIGFDTSSTVGTVTNNGDGTFSYDPNGQFESLKEGNKAIDSFTYIIENGNGETDTATVDVTINGITDNTDLTGRFNLADLDGNNGFVLNSIERPRFSRRSVSSAGDINGDGIDDFIIGETFPSPDRDFFTDGESYVVFGSSSGFDPGLELSSLDGRNGFVINGINVFDAFGASVSGGGDINNDGIDDIIIGAPFADPNGRSSGQSYVVFGSSSGFRSQFDLLSLDGNNGFVLNGIGPSDRSGYSVSDAGDVNGDGFDDVIIGAPGADPNGRSSGQSYVVFGNSSGFDPGLELSNLDGSNGFAINGIIRLDRLGTSVSSAGDVNGDGIDDIIVGAPNATPSSSSGYAAGESYVIFGRSNGFDPSLKLSSLDGSNGFVINGIGTYDRSGESVSSVGDVNGDGFDDISIGASGINESYVVFGSGSGFEASLDLSSLDGSNGFVLNGASGPVSNAGDVNGDGFDDFIVGGSGESYVVFGSSNGFDPSLDLSSLNGITGIVLSGAGGPVSSAGDVNGDGFDDIIVGASGTSESYVVFGFNNSALSNLPPNAVNDSVNTDEDTAISGDVLTNDTDPDNDPLIVTEVNSNAANVGSQITLASGALLTLNVDGTYSYNPNGQFEPLNTGETATDSFTYTITDGSETDSATVTVSIDGITDGNFNIINGTSADDHLRGTSQPDFISGNDGNDTLRGRGDDDILEGGSGGDIIYGNGGNDVLAADEVDRFNDVGGTVSQLRGGSGNDTLWGGNQADLLIGGNHNDVLFGNDGNDTLRGSRGNDVLNGGSGDDRLQGDSGIDTVVYPGNFNDFTFSGRVNNFTVTSATVDIGTDTVIRVEFLQFDDGLFATTDLGL